MQGVWTVWGIVLAMVAWAGGGAAEPAVRVRLVDYAGLMAEVKKHEGKVVVLDYWSTSCPPCVKEFPGLVALADKHGDSVVCLSLAIEYDGFGKPEQCLPPVQAFLAKVGAHRVVNFVASEEADAIYKKLDLASVPAVSVWKPDGSLAVRYDDDMAARTLGRPFTYADIDVTVRSILAEPQESPVPSRGATEGHESETGVRDAVPR
jgi:thiol-disulfide isomerase/thioredoxin